MSTQNMNEVMKDIGHWTHTAQKLKKGLFHKQGAKSKTEGAAEPAIKNS